VGTERDSSANAGDAECRIPLPYPFPRTLLISFLTPNTTIVG